MCWRAGPPTFAGPAARGRPVLSICRARRYRKARRREWCSIEKMKAARRARDHGRSEEHTSELQSLAYLVCRLLLEKKKKTKREMSLRLRNIPVADLLAPHTV